jgi:N-acetylneuraminate synthase
MPVRFMSEVSSNHAQDLGRCLDFVDVSAEIGCAAVKFQLFRIDEMFAPEILSKSEKHRKRKAWELPEAFLGPIAERCHARGLQFCCTPFHLDAVDVLAPHVDSFKIASYELIWDPLLAKAAATGKPCIVSTGMATLEESTHAVEVLRAAGAKDIMLLHCVSAYPTPPGEANLAANKTLRDATACPVGWSDHTVSPGVIHRAVHHWDATLIEFHLDLDGLGPEYAAGHCWLPYEMAAVIREVRTAESADGNGLKVPMASELPDREWRADPSDGLRPMRDVRRSWQAA